MVPAGPTTGKTYVSDLYYGETSTLSTVIHNLYLNVIESK